MARSLPARLALALLPLLALPGAARAQDPLPPPPEIRIARAAGPIAIDGDLSDPAWREAAKVDRFWETNRSDNTAPLAATVARLAYDDHYLYAALEFSDPDPKSIRAVLGDHDNLGGDTDYGGLIVDARNDGKTALMFLANPRGIQYDAVSSDVTGEDSSLDLFWDAAARITPQGWTLELRVPFSSLRYDQADPQTWGILIYRNYPRDFRYQMFSAPLPRGSNCFICHENKLVGLAGLPAGGHTVVAPYATAKRSSLPVDGVGSPLREGDVEGDGGVDLKWIPNADTAIDATVNPDFSQVESDVAQVSSNERFALFFPEKRPFFLEGLDLFSTPLQAVYTRTITQPRWGGRATGRLGGAAYTLLVTDDQGGGSVVLPGPTSSSLADQDFSSRVAIGRVRRDLGSSFVSFLLTDREVEGGAYNRVAGPDFQWRPSGTDSLTGQFLWSDTQTPRDAAAGIAEWDGRQLSAHAFDLQWSHTERELDWYLEGKDIGEGFRADVGFLPQVGYREGIGDVGRPFYPAKGVWSRVRPFVSGRYDEAQDGRFLLSRVVPGVQLEGLWSSFAEISYKLEKVRAGEEVFDRDYWNFDIRFTPGLVLSGIRIVGFVGEDVDFTNERPGRGGSVTLAATLRPFDHLELRGDGVRRWLDVDAEPGRAGGRLFTATVARLKATYTFNARTFLRLIGQEVRSDLDLALFDDPSSLDARSRDFSGSALFGYKLNWQTVLFVGYGDDRSYDERDLLEPARRELFLKVSYAFQR